MNCTDLSPLFSINTNAIFKFIDPTNHEPDVIQTRVSIYMCLMTTIVYILAILKKAQLKWNIIPLIVEIGTSISLMSVKFYAVVIFILIHSFWWGVHTIRMYEVRRKDG